MAQINVTHFAKELGLPIELLIEQLQTAGVKKKLADDTVLTEKDKTQLLDYLRQAHGAKEAKHKITLTRKQTTEIKKSDSTGKARTIQVEVRKKRVLVKRDAAVEVVPVEPAPAPVVDAEQIAKREAEAKRQAELIALQSEEVQQKATRQRRKKADAVAAEDAPAAVETPAAIPQVPAAEAKPAVAPVTEGTLHKPHPSPAKSRRPRKTRNRSRKSSGGTRQSSAAASRRGDASGGFGWRQRRTATPRTGKRASRERMRSRHHRPIVHGFPYGDDHHCRTGPENVGQGCRGHQGDDELGTIVTINQVLDQTPR